jgi:hypothetical protein
MILLGCKPAGRHTEQHDVFFSVGGSLKDMVPGILDFWPGAGTVHIDAWREVTEVDGYLINVIPKEKEHRIERATQLFFLNLGGYKPGEFEEFHYKMLVIANGKSEAISKAKVTGFYKHTGFKGAESHIDDKYGIDVDDIHKIEDILPDYIREKYTLQITATGKPKKDEWQLGYIVLNKLIKKGG